MEKKISFSLKKKPDTRGYVKPAEEKKKFDEEYVSCIEDKKIEGEGAKGSCSSSELVIPVPKDHKIADDNIDYEAVPIEAFGMAMLRGMGWTENDPKIKPISAYIKENKGAGLGHNALSRK